MQTKPRIAAWIYPGPPACSAAQEMADGRTIDVIKAQYFKQDDTGMLTQNDDSECNGYSLANVALIKAHSHEQFATISGSIAGMVALDKDASKLAQCVATLTDFLHTTGFTGIEFDVEDFGSWSPEAYAAYKRVIKSVGDVLHSASFQLAIDGPAISNDIEQGYFQWWKYSDFNNLPVSTITVMAYDNQYDTGGGKPVQPTDWLRNICQRIKNEITDHSRIEIGIPSYGYHSIRGSYDGITKDTYEQSSHYPGFSTAKRDPNSGEMTWYVGNMFYDYSDSVTLDKRLTVVQDEGLSNISVWSLGGNKWFSPAAVPSMSPTSTPEPVATPESSVTPAPQTDALTAFTDAFNAMYPGFNDWYHVHFKDGQYSG